MKTARKIHYGWYIVMAGCLIIGMTTGVVSNCFSQFIKPVCADLGIERQQMSMIMTIQSIASMVFAMFWGSIVKKVNLHKTMIVGAIVTPCLYACYGLMQKIWMGYLVTVVLTPFFFVISMTVFTYILGNWFVKNRGLALSLASMGSGIGGMIMNTVIAQLIIHFGWRATYIMMGALMLVVMLPLMIFVVREKPSDKGLLPYGADEAPAEEGKKASDTALSGITFAEAVRMPVFWAVAVCSVGMVMAICAFYQTLAPHLSDSGYTVTFAATMTSISMGALALGKIALGRMFDTLGIRKTVTIACSCTVIGSVSMLFCTSKIALCLIVLGVGLGCSFGAICMPMITQTIFGMKEYNSIYSKFTAATGLGSAIAPVITGWAYDTFGSYDPAYVGAAIVAAAGLTILLVALPKEAK